MTKLEKLTISDIEKVSLLLNSLAFQFSRIQELRKAHCVPNDLSIPFGCSPGKASLWFNTYILKDNCPFKLLLGEKGEKTNISQFLATHTYRKLTFVSCFLFFVPFPCLIFLSQNQFLEIIRDLLGSALNIWEDRYVVYLEICE